MGTVTRFAAASGNVTFGRAVSAYLGSLAGDERAGTRLVYGRVLRRAEREFGAASALADLDGEAFATWFTGADQVSPKGATPWSEAAPARTRNSLGQRSWLRALFVCCLGRPAASPPCGRTTSMPVLLVSGGG
jgi:hypothetical protein